MMSDVKVDWDKIFKDSNNQTDEIKAALEVYNLAEKQAISEGINTSSHIDALFARISGKSHVYERLTFWIPRSYTFISEQQKRIIAEIVFAYIEKNNFEIKDLDALSEYGSHGRNGKYHLPKGYYN